MPTEDPSGILVYPKVERKNAPRGDSTPPPNVKGFSGSRRKKRAPLIAGLVGAAAIGAGVGYVAKPSHAGEAAAAKSAAADEQKAAQAALDQAKAQLAQSEKDKATSDQQLAALQNKATDVDKKAAELDAAQKKLQGAIDKESGTVDTEGDEIHLKLVDKVLFATGDDQLTDKGKVVLDKVAVALKDLPDKQIWVQGHTDDQPIYLKKLDAVKPAKPDPKAPKQPPKPPRKEYITNWELSAARALQVVHYLQDTSKIDPSRLAALAFGQYRPVSRTNKALNRRIEIVLYPKREILVKDQAPKK
ncbi:MAG TPA: OmpA family protein [Kofleriaceae bacterium]|jgi:chemotaxis protein MotB